jgi:hypothetical protein
MQVGDMVKFVGQSGTYHNLNIVGIIVTVVEKHLPVAENQLCKIFWTDGTKSVRWDDELEIIK